MVTDTVRQKRYLEDLVVGERAESAPLTIDLQEMLDFARHNDPQYFHTDPQAATGSIFGGVIASGIYTMSVWRRLDHTISADIAWICGIAWQDVRWPMPTRAGDAVRARWECVDARRSASEPSRGVVQMRYTLVNERDDTLFSCLSVNLVETRPPSAPPPACAETC